MRHLKPLAAQRPTHALDASLTALTEIIQQLIDVIGQFQFTLTNKQFRP